METAFEVLKVLGIVVAVILAAGLLILTGIVIGYAIGINAFDDEEEREILNHNNQYPPIQ